ncbi:MAG: hypothetical protein HUU01_11710 [Saprospiraceae bacterium]|nr:hypothetical protein [Saprospiraceae bacterium]
MLNTLSDLFLRLKEFLVYQKTADSIEEGLLWLDVLISKEQYNEAKKHLKLLQYVCYEKPPQSDLTYFFQFALSYIDCYKIPGKSIYEGYKDLISCVSTLDTFYAFAQVKLACEIASRQKFLALEKLPQDGESQSVYIPTLHFSPDLLEANPLIHIYYKTYLLITTESSIQYDNIITLLKQYGRQIDTSEQIILIAYLQNYAANELLKGNLVFVEKAHELNLLGLEYGTFTAKGLLSSGQYNNIIVFACRAQKFDWVKTFIEQYTPAVETKSGVNTKNISLAIVAFRQKEFQSALQLLDQVDTTDIEHTARLKPLVLACSYELNKIDMDSHLISMSKAFSKQLSREKELRKDTIVGMRNFIRLFHKLLNKKYDKNQLVNDINKSKVVLKDWLLEKATSK